MSLIHLIVTCSPDGAPPAVHLSPSLDSAAKAFGVDFCELFRMIDELRRHRALDLACPHDGGEGPGAQIKTMKDFQKCVYENYLAYFEERRKKLTGENVRTEHVLMGMYQGPYPGMQDADKVPLEPSASLCKEFGLPVAEKDMGDVID